MTDPVPLPEPFDYCYEWDGPWGARKFSPNAYNGRRCDRSVALYAADQMRAYGAAMRQQALEDAAQAAGPDDSYQDEWFKAKADAVQRIRALKNSTEEKP